MPTIVNGVEYAQMPVPADLWRATKYAHAVEMIGRGLVYLSNARKYQDDPDPERGDPTETDGRFIRQGVACTTGHTNPIFLWCATLDPDPGSVLAVWRDCDTVIHISNPQALAERMSEAAKAQGVDGVSFHAGTPTYDKDKGGTSAYHWAESIFQKPDRHAQQKEYRFALVGSYAMSGLPRVELTLGPCNDIIAIAKSRPCEHDSDHVRK
jgi:hypothetical protein